MTHRSKHTGYQIVTIALARLGGSTQMVNREDIAIAAYALDPAKFCWRHHPERIDLATVDMALRHAKRPGNGSLVTSDSKGGWMLSPSGLKWVAGAGIQAQQDPITPLGTSSVDRRIGEERARLLASRAFVLVANGRGAQVSLQDYHDFVRINEYFGERARHRRYQIVENAVAGDDTLSMVWSYLRERFGEDSV